MEYIYSALLLHAAKKEIKEDSVEKVLSAAGIEVDTARVKALVSSLKDVNIEEAIKQSAVVAALPVAAAPAAPAEAKEEKKAEEDSKKAEEAVGGLSSLFG
jgi:large subunit ribosomal protein L12